MSETRPNSDRKSANHRLLVQLDEKLCAAQASVQALRHRMASGDPAPDELAQLEKLIVEISEAAPWATIDLPAAMQQRLTHLIEALAAAQQQGAGWIERVLQPELESTVREQRVRSVYQQRSLPD